MPDLLQMQTSHLVFILIGHHFVELAYDRMRELDVPGTGCRFTRRDLKHEVDVGRSIGHILVVDELANADSQQALSFLIQMLAAFEQVEIGFTRGLAVLFLEIKQHRRALLGFSAGTARFKTACGATHSGAHSGKLAGLLHCHTVQAMACSMLAAAT